jgi:nucleotide-binding universal stress UspA family protein
MCPLSRIVVATDEEWTDRVPEEEALALCSTAASQVEVCRLGTGSWQMSPAWLAEHVRWPRSDLVVVPASRPLRNTVAAWAIIELLREATCPVLVARSSPRTARVLLATDLTQAIVPVVLLAGVDPRLRPRLPRASENLVHLNEVRLARLLGAAGLRGDLAVVASGPDHPIIGEAEARQAEIVVIGAELCHRVSKGPRNRVAESIAWDAPCSVLVLPTTSKRREWGPWRG